MSAREAGLQIRGALRADVDALAQLWYDGWQDAHARILPEALARYRTVESFADRLCADLNAVRTSGPVGGPAGFCMTKADELYQLYVSAGARGTGLAAALLADGEERIAARGFAVAWLACAIGNERAARFYDKHGWRRVATVVSQLDTPGGVFPLEVWRYEKELAARVGARGGAGIVAAP